MTTLDALIARHGTPAFIKIDVEGFEAEALAGLTQPVAALSFEFTTIQRDVAHACIARCAALGYTRYNAALGESQTLVHDAWQSADAIGAGSTRCRWRRIPGMCMRRASLIALALVFATAAYAADDLAVDVQNASEPILCAEKDNVYLKLISPTCGASPSRQCIPNYIGTLTADRSDFDLNNCPDLAAAPVITEKPKPHHDFRNARPAACRHHDPELLAQEHGAGASRRPRRERRATVAALGARARPRRGSAGTLSAGWLLARAPAAAGEPASWSAYGSSFMIGPIEFEQRPLVGDPRDRVRAGDEDLSPRHSRAVAARRCACRSSIPSGRCST